MGWSAVLNYQTITKPENHSFSLAQQYSRVFSSKFTAKLPLQYIVGKTICFASYLIYNII